LACFVVTRAYAKPDAHGRTAAVRGHALGEPLGMTEPLLGATVAAVSVLHTLVPDHWAPIVVLGRQQGWSVARTGRAAALAGLGAALAVRYAHLVSLAAALALLAFAVFAASTTVTYVAVSITGIAGLQRVSLGPLERARSAN
jgi:hypothetical protein